ncbi:MAG: dihydrofolate reductase family protein [Pseudomonadota bacterium]
MTVWHCHIAVSLDGRIARADGSFDWLEPYPPQDFGHDAFAADLDAVVMGRTTYEVERGMDAWPHSATPTYVVTGRPLLDPPPLVEARPPDLVRLAEELEGRGYRKVGVEGGGQLVRGLIAIGRLDVLEMALIPLVLGDGIPLFPSGTRELPLRLARCEPRTGGAIHLVYVRD